MPLGHEVIKSAFFSPLASVPLVLGGLCITTAVATADMTGLFGVLGLASIACGIGAAVTQLVLWPEQLAQKIHERERERTEAEHADYLRRLRRRLRRDGDVRTDNQWQQLRQLKSRLEGMISRQEEAPESEPRASAALTAELHEGGLRLYRSTLGSLERSVVLWEAAQQMATAEARTRLLRERDTLLDEVGQSIDHLGRTLDHLQTAALTAENTEELVRVRRELEMGLEVAARVEERISDLEHSLQEDRFQV